MSGLKDRMHALGAGAAVDVSTVSMPTSSPGGGVGTVPVRSSTPRDDAQMRREAGF